MPTSTDGTAPGAPADISAALIDVLAEVLDIEPGELRTQPVLAAHDWTSLISLEALAEVESRFSISMDLRTFHSARTVPDLAELVAARTTTAGATTAGATATTEGGRR